MTNHRNANTFVEIIYAAGDVDLRVTNVWVETLVQRTRPAIRNSNVWVEVAYTSVITDNALTDSAFHTVFDYRVRVAAETSTSPKDNIHGHVVDRVHVHETFIDGRDSILGTTSERVFLSQQGQPVLPEDAFHVLTSDSLEVGQLTVRISDAIHAHTADDARVDQNVVKAKDSFHALTDNIVAPFQQTFAQHHIFDATHAHTAERVDVVFNGFYIDDAFHAVTSPRPVAEDHDIQDAFHVHTAGRPLVGPERGGVPVVVTIVRR